MEGVLSATNVSDNFMRARTTLRCVFPFCFAYEILITLNFIISGSQLLLLNRVVVKKQMPNQH